MANDTIYIQCTSCGNFIRIAGYSPTVDLQTIQDIDIQGFLDEHLFHHPSSTNYEPDLKNPGLRFITDSDFGHTVVAFRDPGATEWLCEFESVEYLTESNEITVRVIRDDAKDTLSSDKISGAISIHLYSANNHPNHDKNVLILWANHWIFGNYDHDTQLWYGDWGEICSPINPKKIEAWTELPTSVHLAAI